MKRFFFVTTYDNISGKILASLLNLHPHIHCNVSSLDMYLDNKLVNKNIDDFISANTVDANRFCGNVQEFSAYELQNKILMERTRHPVRKINLTLSPKTRINYLLKSWQDANITAAEIKKHLQPSISGVRPSRFAEIFLQINEYAAQKNIDVSEPENRLFLLALAKVISQDSLDILVSDKIVSLEKLMADKNYFSDFIKNLTSQDIVLDQKYLDNLQLDIETNTERQWQSWHKHLMDKILCSYPQLTAFYKHQGYDIIPGMNSDYSKLISIHLNSNRPAQLSIYFDNIEETADDLNLVEVLVNIDDNDDAMETMLKREISHRKFTIKYITSPRPGSFCDLWKPINKLLSITDPHAYFLLNISDEMLFANNGWDTVLKKYVGYFPDNIFRLRASRNKFRNYFDRWECSFGQDSIPITTKKWIDIGGDWNPCFGPDSYQQLISFYLAKEGKFSSTNFLRELPLIDIKFHGDIPSVGIPLEKAWKLNRDHILAMQICQSWPMQVEARRRAMLLKAHISAHERQLQNFHLADNKIKKIISLIDNNNQVIDKFDYSLNWFSITLTNQIRKLSFYSYFGGGKEYKKNVLFSSGAYLSAIYQSIYQSRVKIRNLIKGR